MYTINTIADSLNLFLTESLMLITKLVIAYIIWLIGKTLINWATAFIDKLDVRQWNFDDRVREGFKMIFRPAAKLVLVLVILDTLGIGSSVISAIVNGLTFTIAIALGLAFGRALEPDAQRLVGEFKQRVVK